jgi:hypothetical protein
MLFVLSCASYACTPTMTEAEADWWRVASAIERGDPAELVKTRVGPPNEVVSSRSVCASDVDIAWIYREISRDGKAITLSEGFVVCIKDGVVSSTLHTTP